MKAPPSAVHALRITRTSLVNIHYGSPTVSQRKRISQDSRSAEALTHKSLAPREHILGLDALFDAFPTRTAPFYDNGKSETGRGQDRCAGSQCASVRCAYIHSVPSSKGNLNFPLRQQIRQIDSNLK
jgi:hypothetical protein